jgi:beta-glucosidase
LVGFDKVFLQPHESRTVHFTVTARDASHWDHKTQAWALMPGEFAVYVGDSSRSLPLHARFAVPE